MNSKGQVVAKLQELGLKDVQTNAIIDGFKVDFYSPSE